MRDVLSLHGCQLLVASLFCIVFLCLALAALGLRSGPKLSYVCCALGCCPSS